MSHCPPPFRPVPQRKRVRFAFERWSSRHGYLAFERVGARYRDPTVQQCWEAWKAQANGLQPSAPDACSPS